MSHQYSHICQLSLHEPCSKPRIHSRVLFRCDLRQELRVGYTTALEVQQIQVTNPSNSASMNITMNGGVRTVASTASAQAVQEAIEQLFDVPCTIQQDSTTKFYGNEILATLPTRRPLATTLHPYLLPSLPQTWTRLRAARAPVMLGLRSTACSRWCHDQRFVVATGC
jgi:hypothetical protein